MKIKPELIQTKPNLERMPVSNFGEIGCGSVVPFVPRDERIDVFVPEGLAAKDNLGTITINGDSLSDYGMYTGDILVFRTNISNSDIGLDTICIVRVNETGEMLAKRIRRSQQGYVTLVSSGGGIKDRVVQEDGLEVVGIVFAVQKLADRQGRFTKPSDKDIPF